jgi:hypothetical protein
VILELLELVVDVETDVVVGGASRKMLGIEDCMTKVAVNVP